MGYRKLSARPRHHARIEGAAEAFKKNAPPHRRVLRAGRASTATRLWFADEARVGQKNGITRSIAGVRRAPRGSRPSAPRDQRTASTYIFSAICPQDGKGAALILPVCNSAAMTLQLAKISAMVAPGKHAVVLLDQADWHLAGNLVAPDNITLLPLPPKCPELNHMENIWQFMRENWLSDRVFQDLDEFVDHGCYHTGTASPNSHG